MHPVFTSSALAVLLLGLGTACDAPKLSPERVMALRQAQTRAFEVPVATVFKAAMAYLQDNTYQIRQASQENGMINAYKAQDLSTGSQILGALWSGNNAKRGDQYDLTLTFDAVDAGNTTVRCNITHGTSNVGGSQDSTRAVDDPAAYKTVMDGLTLEVQRRHMTTTMRQESAPKAAPASGKAAKP